MRLFIFTIAALFVTACSGGATAFHPISTDVPPAKFGPNDNETSVNIAAEETPAEVNEPYLGQSIDELFPPKTENILGRTDIEKHYRGSFDQSGFTITTKGLMPVAILRNGKKLLPLKADNDWDTYWAFLTGEASLLGPGSKQIYVESSGPGGPCCSNYWIVDISETQPRVIFRSEDFGRFRQAMEIFDADGDGVYELVQLDTTFRYMNDECGTCTPEPRAYFKYDPVKKQYLPTTGIAEDFVSNYHRDTEEWLIEKQAKLDADGDSITKLEIERGALAYTADLLFMGEEKKARKIFNKYVHDSAIRSELEFRLANSKFYRYIRSHRH